jgi:hypothetical protein
MKVVIGSNGRDAALATPRTWTDLDSCFGTHGNASLRVRGLSPPIDRSYLGEDGVGVGEFFGG